MVSLFIMAAFAWGVVLNVCSPTVKPASTDTGVTLPIIMYHSFLRDKALNNDYCISPDILENDLKYIKENGYTTVTITDLIKYTEGENLPNKPIMLTFDDGFYNNYYYALPLLKKYGCKGVISPIGRLAKEYSDSDDISPTYGYCSVKDLKAMENSGVFEIANHSYDLHKTSPRLGVERLRGESYKTYIKLLKQDIKTAQRLFVKANIKKPVCFTFPYGAESDGALGAIKSLGFKCSLTCTEKVNVITRDSACLYELGRFNRLPKYSSKAFFERMKG